MRGRLALVMALAMSSMIAGPVRADEEQSFDCSAGCPGEGRCQGAFWEQTDFCKISCYNLASGNASEIKKTSDGDCSKMEWESY